MKRLQRGVLVTLEGIDGSGKTTLARALEDALKDTGYPVVLTKEPGGTLLGKEVRKIVQSAEYSVSSIAESLLYAADRAQHIEEVVRPYLNKGMLVISDRMADSTRAYQGYGRKIDINRLEWLIEWVLQGIKPDVTFYCALDADTAWQRIMARQKALTRLESLEPQFYKDLINGFETIFKNRADVIRLDATQDPQRMQEAAIKGLIDTLTTRGLLA